MKDEGGRMKGMLLCLECFSFILHPSAFILQLLCARDAGAWDGLDDQVM